MSTQRRRVNYADLHSLLFIHQSDGPGSLSVGEKLNGAGNYIAWRHQMEIGLSNKYKLVFVLGTFPKPAEDPMKATQWEACNNLVISWIMNNVSDSIARSLIYIQSASEIWSHLQKWFSLSQGSRKYKFIKDVYSFKQDGSTVSEYYKMLRGVWEELDAMNELPRITTMAEDIANFLNFLNGFDEKYQSLISQILIMTPLPTVDMACGMIEQEEIKGHSKEKCWQVIGYPSWHPRSKKFPQKKLSKPFKNYKGKENYNRVSQNDNNPRKVSVGLIPQQIEQLLKLANTLCVPSFKYRLLSVFKLVNDNNCMMTFYLEFYVVQDLRTKIVNGVGRE
ncbi:hypothetical protein Cgig2_001583 [Carnegiea gigantea]|uniref:Retrotransposon Copia-like N-terminal domain-containing protein n=1 Tax=Carnegiea gigantea TaxID=171969 RepID=A0A9Q1QFB0_9CARY|nr:hypothetical protein Cgig2_001583 [Carnegiea gigantea]